MISLSFTLKDETHTFTAENIFAIQESYNIYRENLNLPDINVQYDTYAAIITAPYKITIETNDYKIPVNNNYAVCIQSKTIPTIAVNNGIYLATVNINGDYSLDYSFDLLSIIYSDISMTIANIYNSLIEKNITINITSSTSFDFNWLYDGNVIRMIYIDHNVTTCPHLFTPKYFANNFEYFDEYLSIDTEYTQHVNLKWLDDLNTGTKISKVNPQLSSVDGLTVFVPPTEVIEAEYSFIPLQGKYIHYKLINGSPCADVITAEEFLDKSYLPIDIDYIANEYNDNARQEIGTKTYVYYKNKKYNTLTQAYRYFYSDMYASLTNNYNEDFDVLLRWEKQVIITPYLYINKVEKIIDNFINNYDNLSHDEIRDILNSISSSIQSAINTVNIFNMNDIFTNILKLSTKFNTIIDKVNSISINDIDYNFWFM